MARGRGEAGAIAALVLAGFVCLFNEAQVSVALPAISAAYGVPVTDAQWLMTGYMLVTGACMPLSTFAVARLGERKAVLCALGVLAVGSAGCVVAPGFVALLAFRLVSALGCALYVPSMMAIVLGRAPREHFGLYNGVMMFVLMAAPALSPTIAGYLLSFGVGPMFLTVTLLSLVSLALIGALFRGRGPQEGARLDVLSLALSLVGFGGVVFGVGSMASGGAGSPRVLLSLVAGVAVLVAFVRRQLASVRPFLNVRVFANPSYAWGIAMDAVMQGVLFGTILAGPLVLQGELGLSALDAGLMLLPSGAMTAVANLIAGMAYDRMGMRVVPFGLVVAASGFALVVAGLALGWGVAGYVAGTVTYAAGLPFVMTSCNGFSLERLPKKDYPAGSALNNTLLQVAGSLGTALATMAVYGGATLPWGASSSALSNGAQLAFLAAGAIALAMLALYGALRRGPLAREGRVS